jgi:hypothetical protein
MGNSPFPFVWLENPREHGGNARTGTWITHVIGPGYDNNGAFITFAAGDMNGDGRMDVRMEAERFLKEFRERLAKFGLELHPEKTRLIEFGRFAAQNRKKRDIEAPCTLPRVQTRRSRQLKRAVNERNQRK